MDHPRPEPLACGHGVEAGCVAARLSVPREEADVELRPHRTEPPGAFAAHGVRTAAGERTGRQTGAVCRAVDAGVRAIAGLIRGWVLVKEAVQAGGDAGRNRRTKLGEVDEPGGAPRGAHRPQWCEASVPRPGRDTDFELVPAAASRVSGCWAIDFVPATAASSAVALRLGSGRLPTSTWGVRGAIASTVLRPVPVPEYATGRSSCAGRDGDMAHYRQHDWQYDR